MCQLRLAVVNPHGQVTGELTLPADGCGDYEVDFSKILPPHDNLKAEPSQLRIWTVSCEGVESLQYEWAFIDPVCPGTDRITSKGDANEDGVDDISDVVTMVSYLLLGGPRPCHNTSDVNGDGELDLSDPIALLTRLFG